MIELSSTEPTTIGFKVNIEGNSETPKARFFLTVSDDFALMFPANVYEDKAIVNIPALSFLSSFKESELPAHFEVLVNGSFFVPWEGIAVLKTPVKFSANLAGDEIRISSAEPKVRAEVDATIRYEDTEHKSKVSVLKEDPIEEKTKTESFSDFIKKKGLK